jgi:hypothetical protein
LTASLDRAAKERTAGDIGNCLCGEDVDNIPSGVVSNVIAAVEHE